METNIVCGASRYGPGVKKPAGGFCLVPGRALIAAWWGYRAGFLRLYDLRVWLACFEAVERRCGVSANRIPRFDFGEIHSLVGGVGGEHVRKAVTRLERLGLLRWSTTGPDLRVREAVLPSEVQAEVEHSVSRSFGCERRVPVPRRILRLLAAEGTRALVATALGHLLRCSFFRAGLCFSRGTCKASWVAEVFGVDMRNVKRARKHLAQLGWLSSELTRQRTLNRHGAVVALNPAWSPREPKRSPRRDGCTSPAERGLPPPRAFSTTSLPPPYENRKLLRKIQEPEPAPRGPAGVQAGKGREAQPSWRENPLAHPRVDSTARLRENAPTHRALPAQHSQSQSTTPPHRHPAVPHSPTARPRRPSLRHVIIDDLRDPHRLAALYDQAVSAGLVTRCEADRLNFFAAAARARAKGTSNPCGLFMALVRQRLWAYMTQADEDAARAQLLAAPPTNISEQYCTERFSRPQWMARVTTEEGVRGSTAIRELVRQSLAEAKRRREAA